MRKGDVQLAVPQVLLKETQANIEALVDMEGSIAYATDLNAVGFNDGADWSWLKMAAGITLTVPATGTAALLGTANIFTNTQEIDVATLSSQALILKTTDNNITKNILEVRTSANAVIGQIGATGTAGFNLLNVPYNVASPITDTKAYVINDSAKTSTPAVAGYFQAALSPTSGPSTTFSTAIFANALVRNSATQNITGGLAGVNFSGSIFANAITVSAYRGLYGVFEIFAGRTATVTNAMGLEISANARDGTIVTNYGIRLTLGSVDSGTLTTDYGIRLFAGTKGTGTLGTQYGIYIENVSLATSSFSIYTNAGLARLGDQLSVVGSADRQQLIVTGFTTQAVGSAIAHITRNDAAAGVSAMLSLTALGSGANGDGGSILMNGKSSTTAAQAMGLIDYRWIVATHGSRKAALRIYAYDTAARLGMEIEADGSNAKLAFYGGTTVVRGLALTAQVTTITHTAPGTPNYAIQDFAQNGGAGIWGFADHDEANSVLKALSNLQIRVAELEARLGSATGVNLFA